MTYLFRKTLLFVSLVTVAGAQVSSSPFVLNFQANDITDPNYEKGLSNLDARQWDAAIANFNEVAKRNKSLSDAAMYWKAYALTRAGRLDESLAAIQKLTTFYPSSRWLKDAKALFLEIQADAGHPVSPAAESDEDLKLLALNTLMQEDSKTATQSLVKLLNGSGSDKTKQHALFVLAQSDDPGARRALFEFGWQSTKPSLQLTAVRMMGIVGGDGARRELASLYTTSSNPALKREILNGLTMAGSKATLLKVAKTEPDQELRNSAITSLSLTGGQAELSQLYKFVDSTSEKRQIINSFSLMGGATALVKLYESEPDPLTRRTILDTLAAQRNVLALEQLRDEEKDADMKKEILSRLSNLHLSK